MKRTLAALIAALAVLVASQPARAHYGFSGVSYGHTAAFVAFPTYSFVTPVVVPVVAAPVVAAPVVAPVVAPVAAVAAPVATAAVVTPTVSYGAVAAFSGGYAYGGLAVRQRVAVVAPVIHQRAAVVVRQPVVLRSRVAVVAPVVVRDRVIIRRR